MSSKKNATSKKAEEKKKQKIVEDKTFGLKNKNKSKSVQKYIKGVQSQVSGNPVGHNKNFIDKKTKEKEEEAKKLEQSLFKPVIEQKKAPVGVDPKSIVCEFFRKGMCTKGDKCKYSHNLEVERKSEKIDLYSDRRTAEKDEKEEKKDETMENWDQTKLETVVLTKHGKEVQSNRSKIVCKYFLEAIENKKYGWFWECPNGGDKCQYMHCLPPGFILKSTKKSDEQEMEPQPIEEIIEEARSKLTVRTPLTLEIFLKWKAEKKSKREADEKVTKDKRDAEIRAGKTMRSGKEMFEFNPDLFVDDEDVLDTGELEPEKEEEDDGPIINIEATGTSIRTTITNADEDNNNDTATDEAVPVDEQLFNEDELPVDDE